MCLLNFGIFSFINDYYNNVDNIIVSPFSSINFEYYPNSTIPCIYPAFNIEYKDTYNCNTTLEIQESLKYYCPKGYKCNDLNTTNNDNNIICLYDSKDCFNNNLEICYNSIISLSLFKGNETSRIIQNNIKSWEISFLGIILFAFITLCIIILLIGHHPKVKIHPFKAIIVFILSFSVLCILCIIYIIMDTLYFNSLLIIGDNCYLSDDINSIFISISNTSNILFIFYVTFWFFSFWIIVIGYPLLLTLLLVIIRIYINNNTSIEEEGIVN